MNDTNIGDEIKVKDIKWQRKDEKRDKVKKKESNL